MTNHVCPKCGAFSQFGGYCGKCQKQQNQEIKLTKLRIKEAKDAEKDIKKMHWKYFLFGGFILGLLITFLIFPLLSKQGRVFVKRSFGYW